jgi:hypothetical protein
MVDFAKFVWSGVGTGARQPEAALKAIQFAHRVGHKGALLIQCGLCSSGRLGLGRRLLAYLLYPIASVRYLVAICLDPFSSDVFHFQKNARRPLLKAKV